MREERDGRRGGGEEKGKVGRVDSSVGSFRGRGDSNEGRGPHRLNISLIISTSVSAFAIFSAEESCGLAPPKRKDILVGLDGVMWGGLSRWRDSVGGFMGLWNMRWRID